jgi:hypothetical protein
VTESHSAAKLDEAGTRRRARRVGADTQQLGRMPHGQGIADRLRRGDEQEFPGGARKRGQPPPEALFDLTRERRTGRQPEATGELGVRQAVRQLHQRQRVPMGLRDDPVANQFVQRSRDHRLKERSRVLIGQAADRELRESCQLPAGSALSEDDRDRLGAQPPRYEGERLRRGAVEPLSVVDHAKQRPLVTDVGQERQGREPHEESIR